MDSSHASLPRPAGVNYDEQQVPPFTLPAPLVLNDGTRVRTADEWLVRRRPELLELFSAEVYGRAPGPGAVEAATARTEPRALAGLATRFELDVRVRAHATSAAAAALTLRLLVWVPNHIDRAAPAFLGLNFFGNHTVHPDPSIRLAQGWVPNSSELGITDCAPTAAARGLHARRWPVELIVSRGYALATLYAGDIDPDCDDGFNNGAHGLFTESVESPRADDAWGTIAAWSWGLSRALDALEGIDSVDPNRIGAIGHSRLGKTALWAAAQDQRFAWVVASCSGRGGAAISRRRFGELTRHLNQRFPHWFARRFRTYDDNEHALPVDQHELLALIAPRPVCIGCAAQDLWADPRGQLLACQHASPVYGLLELEGLKPLGQMSACGSSVGGRIGYHCRPGGHDILAADWWQYLDFVDRHCPAK